MKICSVLESLEKLSAWGDPIPNVLDHKKIKDKEKKLPKLGASVHGTDRGQTGSEGSTE